MDAALVDKFLLANESKFPSYEIPIHRLLELDDNKMNYLEHYKFINPTSILFISIFFGFFGADRFILGHIGSGICKLLTLGGLGFWYIADWFRIMKMARQKNMDDLLAILQS